MSDPEIRPNLHTIKADQIAGIKKQTVDTIRELEDQLSGVTFLEWLQQRLETDKLNLAIVEKQSGVGRRILGRLAIRYSIPYLSRAEATHALWQDLEFREKNKAAVQASWQDPQIRASRIEAARENMIREWQDPEFKAKCIQGASQTLEHLREDSKFRAKQVSGTKAKWQDPKFRQAHSEGMKIRMQDPEFRRKREEALQAKWNDITFRQEHGERVRRQWQDPEFKAKQVEAARETFRRIWQDPDHREKVIAAIRTSNIARWQNPEYRQRMAERVRQARLNPQLLDRYSLPTIHGNRWDIGYAQSAWEANLARILRFVGCDIIATHEPLRLEDNSLFALDFLTLDNRGRFVGYEIMAHPFADPDGWAKLEHAINQHPEINFRIITPRFYQRLRSRFSERIKEDDRFAGWEGKRDNLRTNPDKFAPTSTNFPTPGVG